MFRDSITTKEKDIQDLTKSIDDFINKLKRNSLNLPEKKFNEPTVSMQNSTSTSSKTSQKSGCGAMWVNPDYVSDGDSDEEFNFDNGEFIFGKEKSGIKESKSASKTSQYTQESAPEKDDFSLLLYKLKKLLGDHPSIERNELIENLFQPLLAAIDEYRQNSYREKLAAASGENEKNPRKDSFFKSVLTSFTGKSKRQSPKKEGPAVEERLRRSPKKPDPLLVELDLLEKKIRDLLEYQPPTQAPYL